MKGLTLMQPWASLAASGEKTIDLRTWRTHYRGPLVIVAGAKTDRRADQAALCCRLLEQPHGVALAVVELLEVRPFERGDEKRACFDPGGVPHFSWLLRWICALDEPRAKVKGFLGIRDLPEDATAHVRRTLDRRSSLVQRTEI